MNDIYYERWERLKEAITEMEDDPGCNRYIPKSCVLNDIHELMDEMEMEI